jgi:hypothetical protein
MTDSTRAGALGRPVFYLMLAGTLALVAACYSTSYRKEMAATVDLLSGLAEKLADYCGAGFKVDDREISSEEMGEFYYALNKAEAFRALRRSQAQRPSYRDFSALLQQYAAFLHSADEYRIGGRVDPVELDALIAQRDAVRKTASRVRADLASEK